MSAKSRFINKFAPDPAPSPNASSAGRILQRKCACGGTPGPTGECESCRKKKLQRRSRNQSTPSSSNHEPTTEAQAPPIVHEVLRSTGQPLDLATRGFAEQRFQHDFSHVRVHTDQKAADSARAVDALAYTVGRDVVFDAGQYAPQTRAGRRLLAHELAHVVQQRSAPDHGAGNLKISDASDASERVANATAETIDVGGQVPTAGVSASGMLHRSPTGPQSDPIHDAIIEDFRRREGFPESGRNESGEPVGPSEAEIKYFLSRAVEDPAKIHIAAVPDFLASSLTATRNVGVTVSDSRVVALQWSLTSPGGATIANSATVAGQPNATTQPFSLQPAHFSGANFAAGQYVLYCFGQDQTGRSVVFARRDFNVLSADLTTGTALPTTYGDLTFTQYDKVDANPPANPDFSINVELRFLPKTTVKCTDIAFLQSVQNIDASGATRAGLVSAARLARESKLSWAIDQTTGNVSPFYISETAAGVTRDDPGFGQAGSGGATPTAATLGDAPGFSAGPNAEGFRRFESCAMCRGGANVGQIYGCATWGYTTTTTGQVTLLPRSFRQMPSEQFSEARNAWNVWRNTLPAAGRPDEAPAPISP